MVLAGNSGTERAGRRGLTGRPVSTTLLALFLLGACGGDEPTSTAGTESPSSGVPANAALTLAKAQEPPPNGLQATIDVAEQTVEGRFNRLRFEARLTGKGQASARFERVAGMTLVSTISGPQQGTIQWHGTTLDGFGAVTTEERETLVHLADRLKAEQLARIPLDLACRPGADQLDPAVGAALLLPWQVLLKYQPEGEIPHPREAAAGSRCRHLHGPTEPLIQERSPSSSIVALSNERPFPMTVGYFPLDSEGIAQPGAVAKNNNG